MRTFDIPEFYRSPVIGKVKALRKAGDPRKRDLSPSVLDFGSVRFILPRHFGFCFGVENAIEIAYKAVTENEGKRLWLLSQMIHNPEVNADLASQGIGFLMDTEGNTITPMEELKPEDVVIVPAFGTTLEIEAKLEEIGVDIQRYNTTCPFVEKVWNRAAQLGKKDYSVVIHGKPQHEETRATFSHSSAYAKSMVVKNMAEAEVLAAYVRGERDWQGFTADFPGRTSPGFRVPEDLQRFGVVNQTTMLASDTQAIADHLKAAVESRDGGSSALFANTRDTLCYATLDNQTATSKALDLARETADVAMVVGGYNSSNTSHIVELCEEVLPTFFISGSPEFGDDGTLGHFDLSLGKRQKSEQWWPTQFKGETPTVLLSSGASCPDSAVDRVLQHIVERCGGGRAVDDVLRLFAQEQATLGA
jgi:4-hydroxy-3-methylbut-2-enyl diphosphate reductase